MKISKKHHNQLTTKICDKVSFRIGVDWCSFGRHLNLNETELGHIDSDNQITQEKAVAVLNKWMQNIGDPTWQQLKEHLATFQRYDIIIEVEREFKLAAIADQGIFLNLKVYLFLKRFLSTLFIMVIHLNKLKN